MENLKQVKDILEPVKVFEKTNEIFSNNVDTFFDDLVKQSGVKVEENKITCDEYYTQVEKRNKIDKKTTGKKVLKGFLIAFAVIFFILMILGILALALKWGWALYLTIPFITGGAVLGVGMILIVCLDLNKKIKKGNELLKELDKEIKDLQEKAWQQMDALNNSFTWGLPQYLISSTVPLIQLDRFFSPVRYEQLSRKHGYVYSDINSSILTVQSGSILGNPFVIEKVFYTWWGEQVYTGSLTITWTTIETDSNGHSYTRTHTQVLTASVTKPKPFYDATTRLVYGNNAAPDLTFTRRPTGANAGEMSQHQLARFIKKSDKRLDKKARKTGTFTKMDNSEFEALFGAEDRNHEVQFRLLFTPVAQANMIQLLKSKPYGDDFSFEKYKTLNVIESMHSQNFNYHAEPWQFPDFDFNKIEEKFKTYCNAYFQSLYFDLAPILSIPLYQQYKDRDYIYKYTDGVSEHEVESLANYFGAEHFCHKDTVTDCILKSRSSIGKNGLLTSQIDCYSYKTIEHTEIVPMMGGDGYMHDVPVIWYEYVPLKRSTAVKVLDWQGYGDAHSKETIESIYKKFGIKSVYGQKGITLHLGH